MEIGINPIVQRSFNPERPFKAFFKFKILKALESLMLITCLNR